MPITDSHFDAAGPIAGGDRLNCPPDKPFVLMAHPASGSVQTEGLDKPTWLPELAMFRLEPGVQGVRTLRKGESAIDAFKGAADALERDEGWVIIPSNRPIPGDFTSDGVPLKTYVVDRPCYHRASGLEGTTHVEFYARRVPTRRTSDPVKWEHESMRAKKNRWILSLIQQGVIPVPDEWCIRDRTKDAQKWADQQASIEDPQKRKDYTSRASELVKMYRDAVVPTVATTESTPKRRRASA